jgi:pimeloyl-ACP methyl ester carboxylesterase
VIPNVTLVEFPSAGHSPQVQYPDEFHRALLQGMKTMQSKN